MQANVMPRTYCLSILPIFMRLYAVANKTIRLRENAILNYFVNRSTHAAAESFNAKLKNFLAVVRGVADKKFYLLRVAKLYG